MIDNMNNKEIHKFLKSLSEIERDIRNQKKFSTKRNLESYLADTIIDSVSANERKLRGIR